MRTPVRHARVWVGAGCAIGALVLAGCASGPGSKPGSAAPRSGGSGAVVATPRRDGAEARPPEGLDRVPDAEPRLEPIRIGGPNKPYEALGSTYVPFTQDRAFQERGLASWYGTKFHGLRTSSGEPYDMYAMTAAHPTMPIPSYARVRNPANGREIVVRINDRGPFHQGRVIDLSYTAALRLGVLRGVAPVEVERITYDEIRAGTWRRPGGSEPAAVLATAASQASKVEGSDASARPLVGRSPDALGAAPAGAAPPSTAPEAVVPAAPTPPAAADAQPTASSVVADAERSTPPAVADTPRAMALDSPIAPAPRAEPLPPTSPAGRFWVQLGAFRERDGADAFQRRVAVEFAWLSPIVAVFGDASPFRLQAGPYGSREQARGAAASIREALQLVPVIVERR